MVVVLTLYEMNSKRMRILVPFVVFVEFALDVVRWSVLGAQRFEASTSTTVPTVLARRKKKKQHAHLVLAALIVVVDNDRVFSSLLLLNFGMKKSFACESLK